MGTLLYPYFEFNVYFFKIFVIHIFWENLVPKFKFSKLIEIWYKDTLLNAYYNFNVYFSKIFIIHIMLDKFDPKICCPNGI